MLPWSLPSHVNLSNHRETTLKWAGLFLALSSKLPLTLFHSTVICWGPNENSLVIANICVLGPVIHALHLSTYWIFTMVLENRSYFYLHFTNVETEAQRLSHTPKVTQLASDGAEFTPRPSAFTVLTVTRKTQSLPSWSFHLMGNTKGKPLILRWWFNHSFNDVKEKFQAGWKQVLGYLILTGNRRDVQEGFFYPEGERKLAWNSKGWAGVHQVNWEMSLPDGKKDDETLRQITAGSVQGTIRSQYGRVPRWGGVGTWWS